MEKFRNIAVAVFFICLSSANANAKQPIFWLVWELTPEFIKAGPLAKQGYADKFLKHFMDNMPEYEHHIHWVNVKRWNIEAKKSGRCSPHIWGHFYPEILVNSLPYTVTSPQVLVFPKRHQQRIGEPGSIVSLEELLKQQDLTFMTMTVYMDEANANPRYPVLHKYLEPYIGRPNFKQMAAGTNEINLALLRQGRADYTLGYPTTITAQKRARSVTGEFVTYSLKEYDFYKKIHVTCFGDDLGKTIVKKVNSLLNRETFKKFLSYHEEWNGKDRRFSELYADYFIKNETRPEIID